MNDPFGYQGENDLPKVPTAPQKSSGGRFATASMILGIATLPAFCIISALSYYAFITGVLAIVFSLCSKAQNAGVLPAKAKAGLILGIVGLSLFALRNLIYGLYAFIVLIDPPLLDSILAELKPFFDIFGVELDAAALEDLLY